MATATPPITNPRTAEIALADLHRFTLADYNRMGESGVLDEDQQVELLDGLVVKRMTKGPRHVTVSHRLYGFMKERLPEGWVARMEAPILLPAGPKGDSAPEPDVAVVAGTAEDYNLVHPGPEAVALVVEVAASRERLGEDRNGLERYAWANVPMVWIVNLADDSIEVYSGPTRGDQGRNPHYELATTHRRDDVMTIALGGREVAIPVEEILR